MPEQSKKPSLSVCMIVRNEQDFLRDCLESVTGIADQIVVIDTGSTDDSVAIASEYGAEIYRFEWCDDFSAARNESIKYAKGDWILWLDADERLAPGSAALIRKLLKPENKPVIYKVNIRSVSNDGLSLRTSNAHRLFNNRHGIRFTGRIHEQVSPSVAALRGEERESDMVIDHLGYGLDSAAQHKKNERNCQLLEQMVRESPNSAYAHFTLAQNYVLTDQLEKALKHLIIADELKQFDKDMLCSLKNVTAETYLKLNELPKARQAAQESINIIPNQMGAYYILYRIAIEDNNTGEALRWIQMLAQTNRASKAGEHPKVSTDVYIDQNRVDMAMGVLYQKRGEIDRALSCFGKVAEGDSHNVEVLQRIANIYLQCNELEKAETYLRKLHERDQQNPLYIDLLGTILIKRQRFQHAITFYEQILSRDSNNVKVIKRLAGVYAKVGEIAKAEQHLRRLAQFG